VTLVNWTNEEGVRFQPGLTGSAGFAGLLDGPISGVDGANFHGELARIGYRGDVPAIPVAAYYELHIEQGPVLETAGAPIGVVEGVQGVRWLDVELIGEDRHAGTTPAGDRRDAFMAAAALAIGMREWALALDGSIRLTFGQVVVDPGSINTIPGRAQMGVDIRHADAAVIDRVEAEIQAKVAAMEPGEGVQGQVTRRMDVPPVAFDPVLRGSLQTAADALGLDWRALPSGAMHDASNLARIAPSAMLFVPSRGGISHNEAEWTEPADIAAGVEVLAQAVVRHATRGIDGVGA
jgi:beta-ureidopropionase / N-carbamoyl-L-amino-acid hydrolase